MLTAYKKLFEDVRKGDIKKLYFLYGTEEYIKKEFIGELVKNTLPEKNRAFNLDIFHGDEFDRNSFDDRMSSFPLFAERRVVILKRFEDLNASGKDLVLERSEKVPDSMVFIVESGEDKPATVRSKAMKKAADKGGVSFRFDKLSEGETMNRVAERFRKEGLSIEREALELLVDSVGTGLSDLINEVDKIVLHTGESKRVTRDDIKDIIGRYRTENLFDILNDLTSARNVPTAVRNINRLIDAGEAPIFVLAMLLKRTVQLLQVKMLQEEAGGGRLAAGILAGKLHRSAYFIEGLQRQTAGFDRKDLDMLLENLRWADWMLKTSSIDPKHILEEALLASSLRKMLAPQANMP